MIRLFDSFFIFKEYIYVIGFIIFYKNLTLFFIFYFVDSYVTLR